MPVWALFFNSRGRLNRARFWLALLALILISKAASLLQLWDDSLPFFMAVQLFRQVIFLISIIPTIKRLHDRDRAGWWVLLFYVGPILIALVGGAIMWAPSSSFGNAANAVHALVYLCLMGALALGLWGVVEIGFLPGTKGDNRFGAGGLPGAAPDRYPAHGADHRPLQSRRHRGRARPARGRPRA
jgi:uncharacterized membrane protein YhaH (DUF805 family)